MTLAHSRTFAKYAVPPKPVRRFSVDEYHRLIQSDFFSGDERFELLDGYIVQKMSRNPIHDVTLTTAGAAISAILPAGWHVRPQCGFTTADSEPEPDLVIVRGQPEDYLDRHPSAVDAALLIEISNTTLSEDRGWKSEIYATAGVLVYWIVNLIDRVVEVRTDPDTVTGVYRRHQVFSIDAVLPLILPGHPPLSIAVKNLFPKPIG